MIRYIYLLYIYIYIYLFYIYFYFIYIYLNGKIFTSHPSIILNLKIKKRKGEKEYNFLKYNFLFIKIFKKKKNNFLNYYFLN